MFELRANGLGYSEIEARSGVRYSTARRVIETSGRECRRPRSRKRSIPSAIIQSMVLAMSGTSNVALTLVIIVLAVALILTFVVGRMVLLVMRIMIGAALALAVLIAIVR